MSSSWLTHLTFLVSTSHVTPPNALFNMQSACKTRLKHKCALRQAISNFPMSKSKCSQSLNIIQCLIQRWSAAIIIATSRYRERSAPPKRIKIERTNTFNAQLWKERQLLLSKRSSPANPFSAVRLPNIGYGSVYSGDRQGRACNVYVVLRRAGTKNDRVDRLPR